MLQISINGSDILPVFGFQFCSHCFHDLLSRSVFLNIFVPHSHVCKCSKHWSRLWGSKTVKFHLRIYNILLLQPNSWFTSYWRPTPMKEWPLNNSKTTPGLMWVFQLIEWVSLDICFLYIQGSNTEMFLLAIHGGSPNASPHHTSAGRRQRDVGRGQGEPNQRITLPV